MIFLMFSNVKELCKFITNLSSLKSILTALLESKQFHNCKKNVKKGSREFLKTTLV